MAASGNTSVGNGGVVNAVGAELTIIGGVFENNSALSGGAVSAIQESTISVRDSEFINNESTSENKDYNTSILISQNTYELVKDYFKVKLVGDVKLRGISKPITAYELIEENEPVITDKNFNETDDLELLEELEVVDF